jgi:hypothetical protein
MTRPLAIRWAGCTFVLTLALAAGLASPASGDSSKKKQPPPPKRPKPKPPPKAKTTDHKSKTTDHTAHKKGQTHHTHTHHAHTHHGHTHHGHTHHGHVHHGHRHPGHWWPAHPEDSHLIHELRHAYRVLDAANPVYHGHRARALSEINHAIGHLDREMHARGRTMHHHEHPPIPPIVSRADVRASAHQVQRVLLELSGMQKTRHRTSASHHLTSAVHQLGQALHVRR